MAGFTCICCCCNDAKHQGLVLLNFRWALYPSSWQVRFDMILRQYATVLQRDYGVRGAYRRRVYSPLRISIWSTGSLCAVHYTAYCPCCMQLQAEAPDLVVLFGGECMTRARLLNPRDAGAQNLTVSCWHG